MPTNYFWIHIALAIVLTVLFFFQFLRQKRVYQLLFVIWVPSTLLTYVPAVGGNAAGRLALGAFQMLLFILVIFFMFRRDPKKVAAARAELKGNLSEMKAEITGRSDVKAASGGAPGEASPEDAAEAPGKD